MLEFKLEKELDSTVPQEIGFNYEELKAELTERLDHYNNLVVTEDAIKEAKADRAKLNGLRKAIDDRRKEIKKEYLKPYDGFEKQVKELTTLIAEPIAAIDTQLQVFEEKRAEEKRKECVKAYDQIFTDEKADIFTFDKIMNPSWINKTTSMTKIKAELIEKKNRIDADMIILDTVEEEYRTTAKNQYEATMDITATMNWVTRQKEAAEARKKVEEMAAESRRKAQEREAQANAQPESETRPEAPKPAPVEEPEKLYTLKLEFSLTQKQAVALKQFISQNGITYKKI